MVKLVDPSHEWATEIGRIVIAFGSIEHVTMLCLRQIPRDPIHKATSELNLGPRLKLLLAVLEASTDPDAERLAQLLGDAKKLAEDRNLIGITHSCSTSTRTAMVAISSDPRFIR